MTGNGLRYEMRAQKEIFDQLTNLLKQAELVKLDERLRKVSEEYKDLFQHHNLRLRPSVGSFSLVSYSLETPQLGFSGLRNAESLACQLEALQSGRQTLQAVCRHPPEK